MKNLQELVDKAISICDTINEKEGYVALNYYDNINWQVSNRIKKCWGRTTITSRMLEGTREIVKCTIKISSQLLADNVSDTAALDTIIHEILHTCPGGHTHTGNWKKYAELVNKYYPEYHIKRTTTSEEKGLPKTIKKPKYAFKCPICGQILKYYRVCDMVKYPQHYRCKLCKCAFVDITDTLK